MRLKSNWRQTPDDATPLPGPSVIVPGAEWADRPDSLPSTAKPPEVLHTGLVLDLAKMAKQQDSPPDESDSMMVAAPVSRGSYSESRLPSRVTLSPLEVEIARAAHLSPQEYARQKLELQRRKRQDPERYNSRG
jgi:hypothetical protein